MNSLNGKIQQLEISGNLTLVTIKVEECVFKSIVVETPETAKYLIEGGEILVMFKETEVILAKDLEIEISLRNKMPGTIKFIESGALLSKLILDTNAGEIISIITTNAVNNLGLTTGSKILAMVKTNEVLLAEC